MDTVLKMMACVIGMVVAAGLAFFILNKPSEPEPALTAQAEDRLKELTVIRNVGDKLDDTLARQEQLVRLRQENAALRKKNAVLEKELVELRTDDVTSWGQKKTGSVKRAPQGTSSGERVKLVDPLAGTTAAEVRQMFLELARAEGELAIGKPAFKELLAWAKANPAAAVQLFGTLVLDQEQPAAVRMLSALAFDVAPGMGGVDLKEALPMLVQAAANDGDVVVRRAAIHALAFMEGDQMVPALEAALSKDKEDWGVKMNAAFGLAKRNNAAGVDFLLDTVKDDKSSGQIRGAAERSLFYLKPKRALPYFYEKLTGKELAYRAASATAIGDIVEKGDQAAQKALRSLIEGVGEAEMVVIAAKKAYNKVAGGNVYPLD